MCFDFFKVKFGCSQYNITSKCIEIDLEWC